MSFLLETEWIDASAGSFVLVLSHHATKLIQRANPLQRIRNLSSL